MKKKKTKFIQMIKNINNNKQLLLIFTIVINIINKINIFSIIISKLNASN